VCRAATDEVVNHLRWFEEHPQLPGILGSFAEHAFIERIDEPQDLLALLIAEVDHAGLPFRRKCVGLRKSVDDPLNGEE